MGADDINCSEHRQAARHAQRTTLLRARLRSRSSLLEMETATMSWSRMNWRWKAGVGVASPWCVEEVACQQSDAQRSAEVRAKRKAGKLPTPPVKRLCEYAGDMAGDRDVHGMVASALYG